MASTMTIENQITQALQKMCDWNNKKMSKEAKRNLAKEWRNVLQQPKIELARFALHNGDIFPCVVLEKWLSEDKEDECGVILTPYHGKIKAKINNSNIWIKNH